MDWTDRGIVLGRRRHGETSAVVTLLTREHGRHAGLVRGGGGRRAAGLYQPGTLVEAHWRARLAEHLGGFTCEAVTALAARILDDGGRLAALSATCALIELACPEREPHQALFDQTLAWLGALEAPDWAARYIRWEVALLTELGYGLDLSACAVTARRRGSAMSRRGPAGRSAPWPPRPIWIGCCRCRASWSVIPRSMPPP